MKASKTAPAGAPIVFARTFGNGHSPSIAQLSSTVMDNGRRGEPRMGCDCVQCFGYCMVDTDQALRDAALKHDAAYRAKPIVDVVA